MQTINDKHEKELKVAPKRWVCTTKHTRRTVLLWPNEISLEWQQHLAKEGVCKPMKSWSRKECIVIQQCSTYDGANAAMKVTMTQRSPSRAAMHLLEGTAFLHEPKPPVILIEVPPDQSCTTQAISNGDTAMLATIKDMVESLMKRSARKAKCRADA
uniref:Uncharacterized protein n=1 Tax=Anopheles albimanus TaxID=7167 RepID=A0A8W7K109_ANOAL